MPARIAIDIDCNGLPEVEPVIHATYILVDDQPDGLIIDMDEFDCTCTM